MMAAWWADEGVCPTRLLRSYECFFIFFVIFDVGPFAS
jgi:hypothetical protein